MTTDPCPPPATPLLDTLTSLDDLRALERSQLQQVVDELRQETIAAVSETGGHLGAGLGVVELTVALHYVFDTPNDRLIWDVGHQAYPHKILTGRRDRIRTIRQPGGLSGFTKRKESEYDAFGAGHSSTSISAALGMAAAFKHQGKSTQHAIAVIGDGAMSAGMAYEAMNNAAALGHPLLVILNDNDMSIAPPVGAMSDYLSKLIASGSYRSLRHHLGDLGRRVSRRITEAARKAEQYTRSMVTGGTLFEQLGFYYIGPVDGHNINHLVPILESLKKTGHEGPVLLHAVTKKGYGYQPAEESADKYHGVSKFDIETGKQAKKSGGAPSYTKVFADSLCQLAETDPNIVGITAAMPSGTGMDQFAKAFPDRCYDVGIAEQHAVTFAAGLAAEGLKPFAAIYSTFLQRAYDQIVHDVAIQKLPVRFAIDRAGLVGADGATHAGSFDIAYLGCLPDFVLMAAADEAELALMTATAASIDDRPSALRYPRGQGMGVTIPKILTPLPIGKGRILREGVDAALLCYGARLPACLQATQTLEEEGYSFTVADARFAKPLDTALIQSLLKEHPLVITVEEGSQGGFGALVLQTAHNQGWLDAYTCRLRTLTLPDIFQDHHTPEGQYAEAGLDVASLIQTLRQLLPTRERPVVHNKAVV